MKKISCSSISHMLFQPTILLIALLFNMVLWSQSGVNDPTFNTIDNGVFGEGLGLNSTVSSTSIQSDGKLIVGGGFTYFNGRGCNGIVRFNTDGSLDSTFATGSGFNGGVNTTSIQADGKIIVGGCFTSYNGVPCNNIARLNSDGSFDFTFNIGSGFIDCVYSSVIQTDGKVILGGSFYNYNGSVCSRIARLNSDGTIDASFSIGTGFGWSVSTIAIQSDGKIVAGGAFTSFNGVTCNRIARLNIDGSLDATFNSGSGFDGTVQDIKIQPDGKIIAVGGFFNFNGASHVHLVRLNSNGSLDGTFTPGASFGSDIFAVLIQPDGKIIVGSTARLNSDGSVDATFNLGTGFNGLVDVVSLQSDGKVIFGGNFTTYNGAACNYLNRVTSLGSLDLSFSPGTGLNNYVRTTNLQSDGKIIVGGDFTSFDGASNNRIVRLNADGNLDQAFIIGEGFNNAVRTTSVQSDGKIVVGGSFTSFDGSGCNYITRLNANGGLDITFNAALGFDNIVRSTILQPDDKIIVGGLFTLFNGTLRNGIARLNSDGSLDASFNPGTGFNGDVYSTQLQSDGKIIVAGTFTSYNGTPRNRIARINSDGSLDLAFNPGTGFDGDAFTISIQSDGKILVGGAFTSFNGTGIARIARLNSDGSFDASFDPGSGFNNIVYSTNIQSDGKVIVGGVFTTFNSLDCFYFTRLNSDGSIDNTLDNGTSFNAFTRVSIIQPDGKIVVGGMFNSYNGTASNYITRLNADFSYDVTLNPSTGCNNIVRTTCIQTDGKIIVGGDFTSFNATAQNRITRLNDDGSQDVSFATAAGFNNSVRALAVQSDGKIIVGGSFTSFGGVSTNYLTRLNTDGGTDPTFSSGTGFNGVVRAISIQADGKIIVGGDFTSYNGSSVIRIARINSDGTIDATFNPGSGPENPIFSICIQSDGKIIIGGTFTTYNGTGCNRIARLNSNGSLDATFTTGAGFDNYVYTIAIQADGKIIAGGLFRYYGGTSAVRIVRLNTDGSLDGTFNTGTGMNHAVFSITIQPDGLIVLGGQFTTCNGTPRKGIARLNSDGSLNTTYGNGSGFNDFVRTTSIQPDGKIVAGGNFTSFNSISRNRIGRLQNCAVTYSSISIASCESYTLNSITYNSSGTYTQSLVNTAGCDSIVTLNLTILTSSSGTDVQSACGTYTWIDGNTYSTSNSTATFTLTNVAGCDSIVTLDLTILSSSTGTDVQTACGSYTWIDGNIYTASTNSPTFTLSNAAGCDSVVNLNLTISTPSSGTDVQSACGSYTWIDGNTYTSSTNTATFTLPNAAGCDSVVTLDLTIFQATTGIDNIHTCASDYTWIDGNTYTTDNNSATFTSTSVNGCDSTVTLNLAFVSIINTTDVQSACGSYTWIDGNTYTSSNNIATFTMTSTGGCDSIITLDLTINTPSSGTDLQSACGSYTWIDGNTYTSSNSTATFILTNAAGCDSVVTLNLTINAFPTATATDNGNGTITATGGGTYSWLNCTTNAVVSGATSATFTPTANGTYAAIVTNGSGCKDTSACVVIDNIGLTEMTAFEVSIAPNPATDHVTITFEALKATLVIRDAQGKLLKTQEISSGDAVETEQLASGVYFFELEIENQIAIRRIVRQ